MVLAFIFSTASGTLISIATHNTLLGVGVQVGLMAICATIHENK